ncbi:MAG: Gfo/Idh/MocA family oxidoreductase [Candidatus Omnitrophica bacterium]|nr:Gfo/Idh/MocA family oxidoreductase [Candidatus Omnitrophota bacterium]
MSRRVTVGVVGIGFGQQVLVPAFQSDPRCRVVALCASTLERAQHVAGRLGIPNAYGDWRAMMLDETLDAVAIATPPSIQPEIAVAACARRKHVFCEKPVATTCGRAAEMLRAAQGAGVAHMVDFEFPSTETWMRAKTLLASGALGRVRYVTVSWQVETSAARMGRDTWKVRQQAGGGALNAFGSHIFYYVEWLLGPVQKISAHLFRSDRDASVERGDQLAMICLVLHDGTPVGVTVSTHAYLGSGHRVEIYAEQGTLVLENPTSDYVKGFRLLQGRREQNRLEAIQTQSQDLPEGDGRIVAVGRLVERFVNWVQSGTPSAPTLEDGYRVQCLLDAARKADATGRWVDLESL